jgi:hypothetical protein
MSDLGEIAKLEAYIERIIKAIEGIGFYPRAIHRYAFDTIASTMMSKSVALARSCIILLKAGQADASSTRTCGCIMREINSPGSPK